MSGQHKGEQRSMTEGLSASQGTWVRSLLERHEGALVRYAARLTGDTERARDVVQEVFLRLCRENRESLDGHVDQWLYATCRNRALDVCRKERRMRRLSDEASATMISDSTSPPVSLERRETAGGVLALLSTIPEKQQEVIRLRFQAGLSYRAISAVTKLSVSNVGYLIHTGLKTLREGMADGG